MSSRQLSTAIRVLFTVSIPLALVYLYSRELVSSYFQLKSSIVIFQENRGERAERNVRALQGVAPE
jgi:hypothetical protein